MLDDLERPLGLDRAQPRGGRRRAGAALMAAGLAAAVGAAGAGLSIFSTGGTPHGEAQAVAPIQPLPTPQTTPPQPAPAPPPSGGVLSAGEAEMESGVRVFRGGAAAPSSVIIVPPSAAAPLSPAPDPRLIEKSRHGLLPRRGRDGATPATVYARPAEATKPGAPRIALVVGGMGLNAAATEDAIRRLPPAVSLAFAPYGESVARLAALARENGHEILLQAPMEPFDRAEAPGPHMLAVGDSERAVDDLRWQMGRFVGYIGLVNFLGGRFTSDRAATAGMMRELARRGLDFVDDGSSPQSLAGSVARAEKVGFVQADLRLDDPARPGLADAGLRELEHRARRNGLAVGFAAGLPGTVDRIARFSADLERRGMVLVPVSAAIRAEGAR